MTREVVWHPHLMMIRASELGRLVDHLDDTGMSGQRDGSRAEGTSVAVPILLSLAAEIGLKAWQCRERNGPPDKTHDLLALFDALGENTRRRLEDKMPEVPSLVARLPPYYPGIRDALSQNKNLFVEWRYAHEHHSLFAETGVLKTALKAIVGAYFVQVPHGRVPKR